MKCQNEKRRRELENAFISELANLIATKDMTQNGKKDKCVILQETVKQVSLAQRQHLLLLCVNMLVCMVFIHSWGEFAKGFALFGSLRRRDIVVDVCGFGQMWMWCGGQTEKKLTVSILARKVDRKPGSGSGHWALGSSQQPEPVTEFGSARNEAWESPCSAV